ncbi:MAG: hypothetical protein ACK56I_08340, partial [bacterium]
MTRSPASSRGSSARSERRVPGPGSAQARVDRPAVPQEGQPPLDVPQRAVVLHPQRVLHVGRVFGEVVLLGPGAEQVHAVGGEQREAL